MSWHLRDPTVEARARHRAGQLEEATEMFVAVLVFLVLLAVLVPMVGADSREHYSSKDDSRRRSD